MTPLGQIIMTWYMTAELTRCHTRVLYKYHAVWVYSKHAKYILSKSFCRPAQYGKPICRWTYRFDAWEKRLHLCKPVTTVIASSKLLLLALMVI